MNTTALAAAVAGFLLGGLVASTAASLSDDADHPAGTSQTSTSQDRH